MYGIAIFYHLVFIYIKNNHAIIESEMFGPGFNFGCKIIHHPFSVGNFIYRILQSNGSVLYKHACKSSPPAIITDIVTNNFHLY